MESCHQGDVVIVLPGVYSVTSSIFIPDSITIEGKTVWSIIVKYKCILCEYDNDLPSFSIC